MNGIDVDRLAWTLIHFVWQGALVAALYALARQCMARRAGPNARYLLAWIALALMSVAPLLTWVELRPAAPAAAVHAEVFLASPPAAPAVAAAGLPAPAEAIGRELVPPALLSWIAALWCAGALLFWMRLTIGWLLAARLRATCVNSAPGEWPAKFARLQARLRVSRPVRLLVSARVTAPAVVGWLRPVVLAPACAFTGLAPDQMEAVLLHELAHIRRHDYLINLWQSAVEALLFYHPAVWWVSGHMRVEREFCCDDMAVAASGDALGYARALEELEAARPRRPELAVAANGGRLLRRIARLLRPSRASSPAGPGIAAPVMLAGAILLCMAGFRGWGQTNAIAAVALPAWAQSPPSAPKFDVVSIKPCQYRQVRGGMYPPRVHSSPGRLSTGCYPLLDDHGLGLIRKAYVSAADAFTPINGGPSWIHSAFYEIDATAEGNLSVAMMMGPMMQELLEDRFQLKVHRQTSEGPVYLLTVARGGPKLHAFTEGSCTTPSSSDAPPPLEPGQKYCENGISAIPPASVEDQGGTLDDFSKLLLLVLDRPVINKTGISGRFDIHVEFSREGTKLAGMPLNQPIDGSSSAPDSPGLPSIFAALQEQLGLQLEAAKGPVQSFVIDHIEKPTAN